MLIVNSRRALVLVFAFLVGCASNAIDSAPSIFDRAVGTWDEEDPRSCQLSHDVSFSDDRATMIHTYQSVGYATETDARESFRYSVISLTDTELFAYLENEERLTEDGDPVIWIFRLIDDDNYCWGRADWPSGSCTPKRMRCD